MKNDTPTELTLSPAWDRDTKKNTKEAYDGGFHVKADPKPKKRVVNKRSSLQEFTCR